MIMLSYIDDHIEELEIDESSFQGVSMPVFFIKKSDSDFLRDVLKSKGKEGDVSLAVSHTSAIDFDNNTIDIYMPPAIIPSEMVNFLMILKNYRRVSQ